MRVSTRLGWGILVACAVLVPLFIRNPYVLHVLVLSLIYAILATSLNLITGYSGLLSLGHQAFFGIGAYTSALLVVDLGVPFPLAMLAGGVASTAAACFIGGITLRLRSAYFVISTIAFAEMLRLVSLNWYSLTRGPMGIANIPPPSLGPFLFNTHVRAYYFILVLASLAIVVSQRIVNSHIGHVLMGIRDAEHVAKAVGVYPTKYLLISVLVGGFMAGVAGSFYAHYMRFLSPDVFFFSISVNLIVMVVGGGIGTVVGPVIGAFVFTAAPEVLRFSQQYRLIIYGMVLILVVRFLPGGLWTLVEAAGRRLRGCTGLARQRTSERPAEILSTRESEVELLECPQGEGSEGSIWRSHSH